MRALRCLAVLSLGLVALVAPATGAGAAPTPRPAPAVGEGANVVRDLVVASTFVLGSATLYAPNGTLPIRAGDTVVWTNLDPISHDVTFEALRYSGYMRTPGSSTELTFPEPGYFRYFCSQHPELPGMYGLVYVSPTAPL